MSFWSKVLLLDSGVQVAKPPTAVIAKPPIVAVPNDVSLPINPNDFYQTDVYCCNCDGSGKSYHFKAAFRKGVKLEGNRITCPRCEVEGTVNHYGQVWPE